MSDNKALVIITTIIFATTTIFFLALILPPVFIKPPAQSQTGMNSTPLTSPKIAQNPNLRKAVLGASVLHINRDVQLDGTAWINGDLYLGKDATLHIGDSTFSQLLSAVKSQTTTVLQQPISQITQENNQIGVLSLQNKTGPLSLIPGTGIEISGLTITNIDPGSSQSIFKTVLVGSTPLLAKNNNDILSINNGKGISISTTNGNTITLSDTILSNITQYGVAYADTNTTVSTLTSSVSGMILQSNGPHAPPSWVSPVNSNTITGLTNANLSGSAGITNENLANASLSILTGFGLSGGGSVSLGGAMTLENTGVLSLSGTQNQIIASASTSAITLSLPQNIDKTANPTFSGLTLSNFLGGNNAILYASPVTGQLATAATTSNNFCLVSGITTPVWTACSDLGTNYLQRNIDPGSGLTVLSPAAIADTLAIGVTDPLDYSGFEVDQNSKGNATAIINQTGFGSIVTASASGITKFTINNNGDLLATGALSGLTGLTSSGTITLSGFTANGGPLYTNSFGTLAQAASGSAMQVLHGGTNPSFSAVSLSADVIGILPIANGGIGTNTIPTNGQLLIGNGLGYTQATLTGTQNQVNVTNTSGAITLSLPQNINATASPVFAGLALSGNATTSGNLTFQGATSQVNMLNGGTIGFYISVGGDSGLTTNPALFIAGNGKIGIGTNNPGANALQINGGSLYVNGNSNSIIADGIVRSNTLFWLSNGSAGTSSVLRLENYSGSATGLSLNAKLAGTDGTETEWPYQSIIKDATWTGTTSTRNAAVTFNTLFNNTSKEVLRLASSGFVGIGASNPLATLDIHSQLGTTAIASISGKTSYAGLIVDNSGTGSLFSASSAGQTKFSVDNQGNTRVVASLCVKANIATNCAGNTAGTIYATNQTIQNADYAENYISSQKLLPGEIIMTAKDGNNNAVIKTTRAYQSETIGVVSTSPGITLNSNAQVDAKHPNMYPIALSGRVPVIVSTQNGAIHAGDFLTTSAIAGVGMKATDEGVIIGKALEDFDVSQGSQGTILVYVNIGWANPRIIIALDGSLEVPTSQTALTQPPTNPLPLVVDTSLSTQVASLSSQIQRIDDLSHRISLLEKNPIATDSPEISSRKLATISGNLSVTGRTLLSDVGITGKVTAGLLTINGLDISEGNPAATINTAGSPLKLQSLELAGLDILNGKITIDTFGNMQVNASITAKKFNVDTSVSAAASAGKAIIQKGKTTVDIMTTSLTNNSLIFATPDTVPVAVAKKQIAPDTFELTIAQPQTQDLWVDWWIVN